MTLPTTQKECTTRRIAVLISGLWTKIKNGFVQFSSVGAASGVASLDSNGKVPSSQMPEGIYSDSAEFYTWKPDRRDNSPLSATSGICRSGRGMDPVTYSAGTWLCINVSNGFSNGVVTLYMATHSEANPVTYVVVVSAFRYGRHTIYVKGNQRSGYQRHINKFYLKTDDGQQAFVYFKLESACSFSFCTDGNITSQNVTVSDSAPYSDGIAVSSNDIASNVRMAFGESGYVYGTGGSQSIPVFIDQNGQVQPCIVGTSGIADDSITASKVKDNETLPVNISGKAASADSVAWANVSGKPGAYPPESHTHSDKLNVDGSNGTGEGVSALINKLSIGSSAPEDDDYYVSQFAGGGTSTTSYHRRPVRALWTYIMSKIASVLGLTASEYGGNAATAYWQSKPSTGVSSAKWYSLGTLPYAVTSTGFSMLVSGGADVGGNVENLWHVTVSNRNGAKKVVYTQLSGDTVSDIQFGYTYYQNNDMVVYMRRPSYSGGMNVFLLTKTPNVTPSITEVSGQPSGYVEGIKRPVNGIEHISSIPNDPVVGIIYAF